MARIASRFHRVEPRRRARAYLLGLLSQVPGKNCWTIAETAGDRSPDGMQQLLNSASWDPNALRDDLHGYVSEHLGDPDGVLIVDETGCAPRGAEEPCGRRSPPLVIAVTGEAGDRPTLGSGVRPGAVSTT
ncbi:transposase [Catellatospora sp. NPDC049133]|uniref:transposase n=1 Tax=Catellatospora sp. NPDC049133 TaxID=3155499 RepID=UPI0033C0FEFC